jgi:hypothetical protein
LVLTKSVALQRKPKSGTPYPRAFWASYLVPAFFVGTGVPRPCAFRMQPYGDVISFMTFEYTLTTKWAKLMVQIGDLDNAYRGLNCLLGPLLLVCTMKVDGLLLTDLCCGWQTRQFVWNTLRAGTLFFYRCTGTLWWPVGLDLILASSCVVQIWYGSLIVPRGRKVFPRPFRCAVPDFCPALPSFFMQRLRMHNSMGFGIGQEQHGSVEDLGNVCSLHVSSYENRSESAPCSELLLIHSRRVLLLRSIGDSSTGIQCTCAWRRMDWTGDRIITFLYSFDTVLGRNTMWVKHYTLNLAKQGRPSMRNVIRILRGYSSASDDKLSSKRLPVWMEYFVPARTLSNVSFPDRIIIHPHIKRRYK